MQNAQCFQYSRTNKPFYIRSSPKTPVLREKVKGVRRSVLKTVHTGEKGHQGLKVMIYVQAEDRTHRGERAPGTQGNDLCPS